MFTSPAAPGAVFFVVIGAGAAAAGAGCSYLPGCFLIHLFAKAYSNRAYIYLNKQQYDRAIIDCTKAINLDPDDAVSYLNRGIAYKLQGNEGEAIANFEKTITLSDKPRVIETAEQEIKELSR